MVIIDIVIIAMQRWTMESYVIDVLMPDLVGHDRRPAAFLVYLFLLKQASITKRDAVAVSLQTIATQTGLSKSTAQAAVRHLRRRGLLDSELSSTSAHPVRRVMRPWRRNTKP
jgi:hypothetical protein